MRKKNQLIKAGIVNESNTEVERLAARITELSNDDCVFIKTYPVPLHGLNRGQLSAYADSFTGDKKSNYLGITVISYALVNYLEFYSGFRGFPLAQNDEITLVLDDGREMEFVFTSRPVSVGYLKRNSCFISDQYLQYIAETPLAYWKLENKEENLVMIGSFEANEHNKQYRSKKTGQQLLQAMVKEVMTLKAELKAG